MCQRRIRRETGVATLVLTGILYGRRLASLPSRGYFVDICLHVGSAVEQRVSFTAFNVFFYKSVSKHSLFQ